MKTKTILLVSVASLFLSSVYCFAQYGTAREPKIEIGGYVGGQINGGADLSTTIFRRLEVRNGVNYGLTLGFLVGEHGGVEFQWNHNKADTVGQPIGGGTSVKLFELTNNQYMGNFLFHFSGREAKMRPFLLLGLGASNLSTDRSGVQGSTRFTFAVGGGAKYNVGKHFGLRGQLRYAPTYLTTTNNGGYWCDPFWGGCWVVGNSHYLNEFDATAGITFRF
jgi:opacity protein-like surface antigen